MEFCGSGSLSHTHAHESERAALRVNLDDVQGPRAGLKSPDFKNIISALGGGCVIFNIRCKRGAFRGADDMGADFSEIAIDGLVPPGE